MNVNYVTRTVRQIPQQIPILVNRKLDIFSSTIYSFPLLKFFRNGWGNLSLLQELDKEKERALSHQGKILSKAKITWKKQETFENYIIQTGSFLSPLAEVLPKESQIVNFKFVQPKKIFHQRDKIPLVSLLVHTGDHGYNVRLKNNAIPLAQEGVASIIIENPYYGQRKPEGQFRSSLLHVVDLITLGAALIGEVSALFNHFHSSGLYGPYVVSGFSMGGLISGFCGTILPFNEQKMIGIVPCVAPHSASPIFCEGILQERIDWDTLCNQLPNGCNSKLHAKEKLRWILDRTDLRNFPLPKVPEASIIIAGEHDQYVPNSANIIHEYWKGSQLRFIPSGHITTSLLHRKVVNQAILNSIETLLKQDFLN